MDNPSRYIAQGGQMGQQRVDNQEDDNRPEKSIEDMIRYVRQVGKLNQANRRLVAGVERSKFNQTT